MSSRSTVSYHVGNELEHFINFVSDYTILQDVFPDNATKRKILSLAIRWANNDCPWTGDLRSKEVKTQYN